MRAGVRAFVFVREVGVTWIGGGEVGMWIFRMSLLFILYEKRSVSCGFLY